MAHANWIIDLGPGAGRIVFEGAVIRRPQAAAKRARSARPGAHRGLYGLAETHQDQVNADLPASFGEARAGTPSRGRNSPSGNLRRDDFGLYAAA